MFIPDPHCIDGQAEGHKDEAMHSVLAGLYG